MPLTWSLFHRNPDTFPLPKFNIMYLLKTMLFFFKFEITFYPDQFSTFNNPLSQCQKILQLNSIDINKNNSSTHLKTNISELNFS